MSSAMVHHLKLLKLKEEDPDEAAEKLMIETRIRLLKIPEVANLHCGKRIELNREDSNDFFLAMQFENLAKMKIALESAIYVTFERQVLEKYASTVEELNFEMEPGKDVRYS